MRVVDKNPEKTAYHSQSHACASPGCSNRTREGKPYCSEHVEMNDYASKVLADLARRDAEDAFVLQKSTKLKDYPVDGVTARSILQHLKEHGTRTKARLCRELSLDKELLDAYAAALIKKRLVRLGRTNRGNETLALREPA